MQTTRYKRDEWENYRSIARSYGVTIPALKKIFREEGLLEGNQLSKTAQKNEIGIKETITSKFGTDERILWKVPVVNFLLGKRNMSPLKGDEAYFFAENFSQITLTIGYLGRGMLRFLKFSTAAGEEIEPLPQWYRERFGDESFELAEKSVRGLQEAIYEGDGYLCVADRREFVNLLEQHFHRAFELARLYPMNEYEKMRLMFFKRLYQFIGEWVTDKKISQHHRQPRKQTS